MNLLWFILGGLVVIVGANLGQLLDERLERNGRDFLGRKKQ